MDRKEILAHLAESEIVYGYRIRKALNASGTPIEATDQNVWVKNARISSTRPAIGIFTFSNRSKGKYRFLEILNTTAAGKFRNPFGTRKRIDRTNGANDCRT